MKIIKFIYTPMKFILLLGMIAAVIYFRSLIFQPNINQYINAGLSFAEDKLDITIPSHAKKQVDEISIIVHEECEFNEPKVAEAKQESAPVNNQVGEAEAVIVTASEAGVVDPISEEKSNDSAGLIDEISTTMSAIGKKVDTMFDVASKQSSVESEQDNDAKTENPTLVDPGLDSKEAVSDDNEQVAVASVTDNNAHDIKQVLMMARRSFWQGNMSGAESFYLDLIKIDDSVADVYGELGNVYYSQGKWKQAGKAYYEAAVRLLTLNQDEKNSKRVSYLLRVIQGLDMESAEKLKTKISG